MVAADNLDATIGGQVESVTYTDAVLGGWNDASFHAGVLRPDARVSVNGVDVGQVLFAPYQLDITSALQQGGNEIEITLTPCKINRYVPAANGQYNAAALGYQDAGLVGPVSLQHFSQTP